MRQLAQFPEHLITEDGQIFSSLKNRFLKGSANSCGYNMVFLCGKWRMIAPLVALTYIGGKPSQKHEVNHKDHNKQNNHYSNLEWLTHKQNIQASYDMGIRETLGRAKGFTTSEETKRKQSKAHCKKIIIYNSLRDYTFDSIHEAANYFNIKRDKISKALNGSGKTWFNSCWHYVSFTQ